MAGSSFVDDEEVFAGINVTPLVDVVLVLLVIFLMTAPVIYQSAIKIQLPKAASGEAQPQQPIRLALSSQGELTWDDQVIDWPALSSKLAARGSALADQTAVISADQATPHGTVVRLMDVLRQSGLTKIGINVDGAGNSPSQR
jgi:biopolymer transport protein ExbD